MHLRGISCVHMNRIPCRSEVPCATHDCLLLFLLLLLLHHHHHHHHRRRRRHRHHHHHHHHHQQQQQQQQHLLLLLFLLHYHHHHHHRRRRRRRHHRHHHHHHYLLLLLILLRDDRFSLYPVSLSVPSCCASFQHPVYSPRMMLLLVARLTSQQQASVPQGRVCSDSYMCCHTDLQVADQSFPLTQSRHTDTGPTSPGADAVG